MPGELKFYKADPDPRRKGTSKDSGAGQYWFRGFNSAKRKKEWSKYTGKIDGAVKAKKFNAKTPAKRRNLQLKQAHLGDANIHTQTRRPTQIMGKKLVKTKKGWF